MRADEPKASLIGNSKGWLLAGVIALVGLLISGALIQRSLPKPVRAATSQLLAPGTGLPRELMTDGSLTRVNEPIYWVARSSDRKVWLKRQVPLAKGSVEIVGSITLNASDRGTYDIAPWRNWRDVGLFHLDPKRDWIDMRVYPSRSADGSAERFRVPISLPSTYTFTDFDLTLWSGQVTDLFVTTCFSTSESCTLRIFSGESGFRSQLASFPLPFGSLHPKHSALEIGRLSSTDLFVVRFEPELSLTEVVVLSSTNQFSQTVLSRRLDLPVTSVVSSSAFLLGRNNGSPAIYFAQKDGKSKRSRVEVFPLALPLDL